MSSRPLRIYVASSWRNHFHEEVVCELRDKGHEVYDFKNPRPGSNGFHWSEIDPDWQKWDAETYRVALTHPVAQAGYASDRDALAACDVCVLVLPCGRSAHLEAGWAAGNGKPTVVLLAEGEPELMYLLADALVLDMDELVEWLERQEMPGD